MERKDNDREGSPLPSSLIPHLMTRDSSTRTTLDSILPSAIELHDLNQPYTRSNTSLLPPLAADPVFSSRYYSPRPYFPQDSIPRYGANLGSGVVPSTTDRGERLPSVSDSFNAPPTFGFQSIYDDPNGVPYLPPLSSVAKSSFTQREQFLEAGPSSQVLYPRNDHRGHSRRGHGRSRSQEDSLFWRRHSSDAAYAAYGPGGENLRQETEGSYPQQSEVFTQPGDDVHNAQSSGIFQDFPLNFPHQQADIPNSRQLRHSNSPTAVIDSFSFDPFARRSSIEYPPADSDSGHGMLSTSLPGQNDARTFQSKKRPRTLSVGADQMQPKNFKAFVACNFCRARKIRCEEKPICKSCSSRGLHCEFESKVRRRGPGKAAKGSRSKTRKAPAKGSKHISPNDRISGSSDNGQGPIAPELQVSSVRMGFNFTTWPPDTPPPYSSLTFPSRERSRTPF